MSDATYVGSRLKTFETTPQFDGYTKVVIEVSDEVEFVAGNDLGRTLRLNNPWGTQEIANSVLQLVRGFQYQPYTASGAQVDPAAEIGDGITLHNVYSGLYKQTTRYGRLMLSDVSAPTEHAIDHEYPYVPKQERRFTRSLRQLTTELKLQAGLISAEVTERKTETERLFSQLAIQASQISAKVERTGGNPSSFGWVLDDASWTIKANNRDILRATKNGLEVYGKVTATSGVIGGFKITSDSLTYNNQAWGGTNTNGIYIGPSGIQLGKNFRVDAAGNLTASSGTFDGNVKAGSIQYGGDNGTLNGSAITPKSISGGSSGGIKLNSLSTVNLTGGINTSLGYADFSNGVFNGYSEAQFIKCLRVQCSGAMSAARLTLGGRDVNLETINVATPDGGTATVRYLNWSY